MTGWQLIGPIPLLLAAALSGLARRLEFARPAATAVLAAALFPGAPGGRVFANSYAPSNERLPTPMR